MHLSDEMEVTVRVHAPAMMSESLRESWITHDIVKDIEYLLWKISDIKIGE